jgi:hypothetical protein
LKYANAARSSSCVAQWLGELFRVELLAKGHGFPVTDFERQRDRFGDYVIRGEQVVGETKTLERVEDLNDASVMRIPFG